MSLYKNCTVSQNEIFMQDIIYNMTSLLIAFQHFDMVLAGNQLIESWRRNKVYATFFIIRTN